MESSADLHANALMRGVRWLASLPVKAADVATSGTERAALQQTVAAQLQTAVPLTRRGVVALHDVGFTAINATAFCVALSLSVGRRPLTRFFAAAPAVHWGTHQYNEARRTASLAPTEGSRVAVGSKAACAALPGLLAANLLAIHLYLSPSVFRPFAAAEALFSSTPARHRRLFFLAAAAPAFGTALRIAAAARAPDGGRTDDHGPSLEQRLVLDFAGLSAVASAGRLFGRTVMMPHYVPQPAALRWSTLPVLALARSLLSAAWEEASPLHGLRCSAYHRVLVPAIGGSGSNAGGHPVCRECGGEDSRYHRRAARNGCALVCADCPSASAVVACAGCVGMKRRSVQDIGSLALADTALDRPVCGGCRTALQPSASPLGCSSGVACAPGWRKYFKGRAACCDGDRRGWWCPDCDARTCQRCADALCNNVRFE